MRGFQGVVLLSALISINGLCHFFPHSRHSPALKINIIGNVHSFVSGSVYAISVENAREFSEFVMALDGDNGGGSLQILNDNVATFSEDCSSTVIHANRKLKNKFRILWNAPFYGCANIKAAVLERSNDWVYNNKTLCALDNKPRRTSPTKCCSCDHATYRIIFEGLWSKERHPKDFPVSSHFTHFSDVIGATHTANFTMWAPGQYATYGFKQLAEFGVITELEIELKNASKHLRSIVRATGLWYPDVNSNTTALFKVDPRHPFLSLASMFGPSPDWVVGLSSLNLCTEDCKWIEDKEIELFPYDAGTDDGITYSSQKSPTTPPERIRRITTMYPEDPRSPFYNPVGGEIPSVARIFLRREKLVNKLCSDLTEKEIMEQVSLTENTEDEDRPGCEVTKYSGWSSCTVSCGKGIRMRTRHYLNPEKARKLKCDRLLISREMCVADRLCPGEDDDESVVPSFAPGQCDVTAWSEWSDCTVTCGIGFRLRTRTFLSEDELVNKKCSFISTMEKEKCMGPQCNTNHQVASASCGVNEWSDWSPCSPNCGSGTMVRVRNFLSNNNPPSCSNIELRQAINCSTPCNRDPNKTCKLEASPGPCRGFFDRWFYNSQTKKCEKFVWGGCRGNKNNFETLEDCNKFCSIDNYSGDYATKKPENCVVSRWGNWSSCQPCLKGTKTKSRRIIREPKNGGKACPALSKTIPCSVPPELCEILDRESSN